MLTQADYEWIPGELPGGESLLDEVLENPYVWEQETTFIKDVAGTPFLFGDEMSTPVYPIDPRGRRSEYYGADGAKSTPPITAPPDTKKPNTDVKKATSDVKKDESAKKSNAGAWIGLVILLGVGGFLLYKHLKK